MISAKKYKQQGMTLIEVMVALVIFSLAGAAVVKATSDHINSVSRIQDVTMATWVANNHINQLLMTERWPIKNNQKGSVEMANRTLYWQQQVAATNDDTLKQVTIQISLTEDYKSNVTSVTTFIAKPSSAGS